MIEEKAEKIFYIILIILTIFLSGVQFGIHRGIEISKERIEIEYQY